MEEEIVNAELTVQEARAIMQKLMGEMISEKIREIWQEMKVVEQFHDGIMGKREDFAEASILEEKYSEIDILFGHESTLDKSIIFYLDNK